MLQFYIPEVMKVEQVLDETDKLAQDEFDKLEKRLQSDETSPESKETTK